MWLKNRDAVAGNERSKAVDCKVTVSLLPHL